MATRSNLNNAYCQLQHSRFSVVRLCLLRLGCRHDDGYGLTPHSRVVSSVGFHRPLAFLPSLLVPIVPHPFATVSAFLYLRAPIWASATATAPAPSSSTPTTSPSTSVHVPQCALRRRVGPLYRKCVFFLF